MIFESGRFRARNIGLNRPKSIEYGPLPLGNPNIYRWNRLFRPAAGLPARAVTGDTMNPGKRPRDYRACNNDDGAFGEAPDRRQGTINAGELDQDGVCV